jgi:hypothetical protein
MSSWCSSCACSSRWWSGSSCSGTRSAVGQTVGTTTRCKGAEAPNRQVSGPRCRLLLLQQLPVQWHCAADCKRPRSSPQAASTQPLPACIGTLPMTPSRRKARAPFSVAPCISAEARPAGPRGSRAGRNRGDPGQTVP